MRTVRRVLTAAAVVLLVACGSDDAAQETTTAPPTTTTPPATSATSAPAATTSPTPEPTATTAPAVAAGLVAPSPGVERRPADPAAPVHELTAGLNDAGFALLRELPVEDNAVFSPASIGHALLMARAAADPSTAAAIDAAFGLPAVGAHEAWNAVDQQLAAAQTAGPAGDLTLRIADRIWPAVGVTPAQEWVDLLAAHHGADVETLDLQGDPEGSRQTINDWVAERTEDLIPELLPEGFVNPQTVLVLTDALYLAADWQKPFGKYGPVPGTFTTLDGTEKPVELMQELELGGLRGTGGGFVGAEIPYVGNELAMLVIVPDEGRFEEIRAALDQSLLDTVDATFGTGPYELLLPKWDDEYQIDLLTWLTDVGAAPGRYPAITPDAFLGAAVHGANIAVDEYGTVAAAATGLGFEESGPPAPQLTVAADQPFLYVIRHRPSGLVLFTGQVTDPTI